MKAPYNGVCTHLDEPCRPFDLSIMLANQCAISPLSASGQIGERCACCSCFADVSGPLADTPAKHARGER